MYTVLYVNHPLLLSDFFKNLNFICILARNTYQISWKSVQCEPSCSMRTGKTDRYTDMRKLMVAFRNLANALVHCTGYCMALSYLPFTYSHRVLKMTTIKISLFYYYFFFLENRQYRHNVIMSYFRTSFLPCKCNN